MTLNCIVAFLDKYFEDSFRRASESACERSSSPGSWAACTHLPMSMPSPCCSSRSARGPCSSGWGTLRAVARLSAAFSFATAVRCEQLISGARSGAALQTTGTCCTLRPSSTAASSAARWLRSLSSSLSASARSRGDAPSRRPATALASLFSRTGSVSSCDAIASSSSSMDRKGRSCSAEHTCPAADRLSFSFRARCGSARLSQANWQAATASACLWKVIYICRHSSTTGTAASRMSLLAEYLETVTSNVFL
mmetsp:Transcript_5491/g.16264  ORF Transcript_5491/g.16264 Transcript_5491/m.16264 type:complete len:252 (-) Transcript_5491:2442-3197(-)